MRNRLCSLVFQDGDLALAAGVGFGDGADGGVGLLDGQHQLLGLGTQGRAFFVKLVQLAAQAVIVRLGGLVLALLVPQGFVGAADGIHPECDLQRLALLAQFQKLLGLFTVPFQGPTRFSSSPKMSRSRSKLPSAASVRRSACFCGSGIWRCRTLPQKFRGAPRILHRRSRQYGPARRWHSRRGQCRCREQLVHVLKRTFWPLMEYSLSPLR